MDRARIGVLGWGHIRGERMDARTAVGARCAGRVRAASAEGRGAGLAWADGRFLGSPPGDHVDAVAVWRAPLGMTAVANERRSAPADDPWGRFNQSLRTKH